MKAGLVVAITLALGLAPLGFAIAFAQQAPGPPASDVTGATVSVSCAPSELVAKVLGKHYGESVAAVAVAGSSGDTSLEIWTNPKAQTITVVTRRGGFRCVVIDGKHLNLTGSS